MLNIGERYTKPIMIEISNGKYVCEKGNKLKTKVDCICQSDLYYHYKAVKEKIPKGTTVEVNYYWKNFYGDYVNVTYKNKNYDIKTEELYYE